MDDRHKPAEHVTNTLMITCARNGITDGFNDVGPAPVPCSTLADLEEFTADIRRHGGQDDLVIKDAQYLVVTVRRP